MVRAEHGWVSCLLLIVALFGADPTDAGTPSADYDGDGFTVGAGDCDDHAADTYPGADEACDGRDNDCNLQIDDSEACAATCAEPGIASIAERFAMAGRPAPGAARVTGLYEAGCGFYGLALNDEVIACDEQDGYFDARVAWSGKFFGVVHASSDTAALKLVMTIVNPEDLQGGIEPSRTLTFAPCPDYDCGNVEIVPDWHELVWNGVEFAIAFALADFMDPDRIDLILSAVDPVSFAERSVNVTQSYASDVKTVWAGDTYAVAWAENAEAGPTGFLARFGRDLQRLGPDVQPGYVIEAIAWNGAGFGVVWREGDDVWFATLTADGAPLDPPRRVSISGEASVGPMDLEWIGQHYLLAWNRTNHGSGATRFAVTTLDPAGTRLKDVEAPRDLAQDCEIEIHWDGIRAAVICDYDNYDYGYSVPLFTPSPWYTIECDCTDGDGDASTGCVDCDDADPDTYPGAPQVCDGVNNDCDDPGFPEPLTGELPPTCVDSCGLWREEQRVASPPQSIRSMAASSDDLVLGLDGVVHAYRRDASGWSEAEIIDPTDPATAAGFGRFVALDGARLAVSATGAVFMFEKGAGDRWQQTGRVTAPDPGSFSTFGDTVALDTDHMLVLASGPTTALLYRRDLAAIDGWRLIQSFDEFPYGIAQVALDGDWAIAGSFLYRRDLIQPDHWAQWGEVPWPNYVFGFHDGIIASFDQYGACGFDGCYGEVHLSSFNGTSWSEEALIDTSYWAVPALGDGLLAVGEPQSSLPATPGSGSVGIYARDEGGPANWGKIQSVSHADRGPGDALGEIVAMGGGALAAMTSSGPVYVFEDASWQTYFVDEDGDGFGDDARSVVACGRSPGFVRVAGDCNDVDPFAYPDADEFCDGGDNDCDGSIDESGAADELLYESFDTVPLLGDPEDWFDTDVGNSLDPADTFQVLDVDGERVFGSVGNQDLAHSHYDGAGSDGWSNYTVSGRLRIDDPTVGIGVTILSDYPESDTYYYLRRTGGQPFFGIRSHGIPFPVCTPTNTPVDPAGGGWYRFELQAANDIDATRIRAKVWPEGSAQPQGWQTECVDTSADRLTHGTTGLYVRYDGGKFFDDLRVVRFAGSPCGTTDVGACELGASQCIDGQTVCVGVVEPTPELCDGLDNNCNGFVPVDELDADGDGHRVCDGDCADDDPLVHPGAVEACNALDDDCDTLVDEDAFGEDSDSDAVPNACDNCRFVANPGQSDFDGDSDGDACDLDDGVIRIAFTTAHRIEWENETGFDTWSLYRGELETLRTSGIYTQLVGSNPLAAQFCNLVTSTFEDPILPAPGSAAFYLTAGTGGTLGQDSDGVPRSDDNPCP